MFTAVLAIIFLPCSFFLSSSSSIFFSSPSLSCHRLDVYHTSTQYTWRGPSANWGCRSEMCSTRLAENNGCKVAKNLPPAHHRTTLFCCFFATKAYINNRKKNLLSSNISPTCPHNMVNFGPLALRSFSYLGHPRLFQRVSRLGSVTAWHSSSGCQPNYSVEQRAPPIFGRVAITLAHISSYCC